MIPSVVFEAARYATAEPKYMHLLVFATSGVTVVAYSAFLLLCAWLAGLRFAGLRFAARISLAVSRSHAPLLRLRLHSICRTFPTIRPEVPTG